MRDFTSFSSFQLMSGRVLGIGQLPFLSFQFKKLAMLNKTFESDFMNHHPLAHLLHFDGIGRESTNFLTCTLGSCRSISSLRLVTLDGIYPRGKKHYLYNIYILVQLTYILVHFCCCCCCYL